MTQDFPLSLRNFKKICEHMGIPHLAIFNYEPRDFQKDESMAVPPEVTKTLAFYLKIFQTYTKKQLEIFKNQIQKNPTCKKVFFIKYKCDKDLWRYQEACAQVRLPKFLHQAIIRKVRLDLKKTHPEIESEIVLMEPLAYKKWLKGNKDDTSKRVAWAKDYLKNKKTHCKTTVLDAFSIKKAQ